MDWMLFWNAFGAVGGTLGALATVAAVTSVFHRHLSKAAQQGWLLISVMCCRGNLSPFILQQEVSDMNDLDVVTDGEGIFADHILMTVILDVH